MARIKLSKIAKYGVKDAKVVEPFQSDHYKELVKEANERIENEKKRVARRRGLYV